MAKHTAATILLACISAIVIVTLILWEIEKVKHRRAVRSAFCSPNSSHDEGEDESKIDPYGVGMSDTDIL